MEQPLAVSIHQPASTLSSPPTVSANIYVPSSTPVAVHVPHTSHRQPPPLSITGKVPISTISSTVNAAPSSLSSTTSTQSISPSLPPKPLASTQPQTSQPAQQQSASGHSVGVKQAQAPFRSSPTQSYQSKYGELLNVIEDLGREIKPTYAGSKMAQERLKKGIMHARALVRDCLAEVEKSARQ